MTEDGIENTVRAVLRLARTGVREAADDPAFYAVKAALRKVFAGAMIELLPGQVTVFYKGRLGVVQD